MPKLVDAPWLGRSKKAAEVVGLCTLSGLAGAALTRHSSHTDYNLSYADFVSILLTAVSLLITVLAVFLAVLGFLGWTTIESKVHSKTEDILSKGFAEGGRIDSLIVQVISSRAQEFMFKGVQSVGEDEPSDD